MPNKRKKNDRGCGCLKHLDLQSTASSNDFTGMIPANPQFTEQLDEYNEIHAFGPEIKPEK